MSKRKADAMSDAQNSTFADFEEFLIENVSMGGFSFPAEFVDLGEYLVEKPTLSIVDDLIHIPIVQRKHAFDKLSALVERMGDRHQQIDFLSRWAQLESVLPSNGGKDMDWFFKTSVEDLTLFQNHVFHKAARVWKLADFKENKDQTLLFIVSLLINRKPSPRSLEGVSLSTRRLLVDYLERLSLDSWRSRFAQRLLLRFAHGRVWTLAFVPPGAQRTELQKLVSEEDIRLTLDLYPDEVGKFGLYLLAQGPKWHILWKSLQFSNETLRSILCFKSDALLDQALRSDVPIHDYYKKILEAERTERRRVKNLVVLLAWIERQKRGASNPAEWQLSRESLGILDSMALSKTMANLVLNRQSK